MSIVDQYKNNIKKDLTAKKQIIPVAHYRAQQLFGEVLKENPALATCVEKYTFEKDIIGGNFNIQYVGMAAKPTTTTTKTTAPKPTASKTTAAKPTADKSDGGKAASTSGSKIIYTKAEFEELMHVTIRSIKDRLYVKVYRDIDIKTVYNDFIDMYGGFYSNLIRTRYEWTRTAGKSYMDVTFYFVYRIGKVKLIMMERALTEKLNKLDKELYTDDMYPETKAFIAHNYLIHNVEYWHNSEPNALERSYMQSAYGALLNGRCVCQGYAEAYKHMLNHQGITCEVIVGKVHDAEGYHAWNIIGFNKKDYFHVDVTWDDSGGIRYDYYGKSDSDMSDERDWPEMAGMACKSDKDILSIARLQISANKQKYLAHGIDRKYLGL